MIDLPAADMVMVKSILQKHVSDFLVWAFGSRTTGIAKRFSDLDLAIISNDIIPMETVWCLQDEFSESDLPIKVDIVDFHRADPEFQEIIKSHKVVVQHAENTKLNSQP